MNWKHLLILLAIPIGWLLKDLLKWIFKVPRPTDALAGYAFPSGHVTVALILALCMSYLLIKGLKDGSFLTLVVVSYSTALTIGFYRVQAGYHTWFDILGGLVLGSIVFWISKAVIEKWVLKQQGS